MIEIYLLEQLYAFKKYGTLSLAAKHLYLTQPSLSRSMQKLEDLLAVKLFDRQKNRITLNETGKLAAEYAKEILDSEKEMINKIRAFDKSRHSISIGSCAPGPLILLRSKISSHQSKENIISTIINSEDSLIKGLKNYDYNLIILSYLLEEENIYSVKYTTEQLYVNLPSKHPYASYDKISFEEMDGQSFIMYDKIGIWDKIVRNHMPNSKFFVQNDIDAIGEISRSSDLPSFSSNITMKFLESRKNTRINIPFLNSNGCITFYLSCLSNERKKLSSISI